MPSGGVGLIPGTTILTSVIQVNLDPRGAAFKSFLNGGHGPRGPVSHSNPTSGANYVIDTGSFYPATARFAGLAWEWATKPGSPYLYRLDGVRMHADWLDYCEAGIDYLRERVFPWWSTQEPQPRGLLRLGGFDAGQGGGHPAGARGV